MKLKLSVGACLLVSAWTPSIAQSSSAVVPDTKGQIALLAPRQDDHILRAGMEVPLTTREELTTKKKLLRVGQRFQMEVAATSGEVLS